MSESDDLIRKLRRPPSVANWVRYNYKRVNDTARALLAFVLGRPRSSLQAVYRIIGDAVHFGRTYEESMRSVAAISSPRTRAMAYEIVPAFFRYNGREKLDGLNVFPGLKENYPVGRNVSIPVEPTFTILKDGQLKPVFVVGWVAVALDDYQKRIMSTIVTESILRLSDFQGSEAIFIFFPRIKGTKERYVRVWTTADYAPLDHDEMKQQLQCYGQALEMVEKQLRSMFEDE